MATWGCVKTYAGALKSFLNSSTSFMFQPEEKNTIYSLNTLYLNGQPWHCLPYPILVKICRYLPDRDRWKMSAVCRQWRTAALNPTLWKSHLFYLYSNSEAPVGLRWLQGRGQHLRQATLMCFGNFDKPKQQFLKTLQRSNLTDLDINGTAYWWSAGGREDTGRRVMAKIVRLIMTQRQLEGFQMRQAMLDYNSGIALLDTVASASGTSLTRLGLEDFFGDEINIPLLSRPEKFAQTMTQFSSLNHLTVNYEYLTDSLVRWLAGRQGPVTLYAVSWLTHEPVRPVSKEAWSTLAASPGAKVLFVLQNIRNIRDVILEILQAEIPLHRLDLVGIAALGDVEMSELVWLLHHIQESYSRTLVSYRLWCDNYESDEIEEALLYLICRCPNLMHVDLHLDLNVNIIGRLCQKQQESHCRLKSLRLARSLTSFQEFETFRKEVVHWYPVLKDLGLDFHIRAESAPSHSAWHEYVYIIADCVGILDSEEEYTRCEDITDSNHNALRHRRSQAVRLRRLRASRREHFSRRHRLRSWRDHRQLMIRGLRTIRFHGV